MKQLRLDRAEDRAVLARLREERGASEDVGARVAEILAQVRDGGDAALRELTARYDRAEIATPRLDDATWTRLADECDPALASVMEEAAENIRAFHLPQRPVPYVHGGGRLVQRVVPLTAVGLYVPGGRASYPSTVLMCAVPARLAGVRRVCVATPPRSDGTIPPSIARACRIAGVTDVFLLGGAHAIGAFAFGTETVPRVDKVCGPGNIWVAEAKRQVAGRVGVDMFAGPSEVLVLDDGRARPELVAYDLLAQAEHDPSAMSICVTTSEALWHALPGAVDALLAREPNPVAQAAMEAQGAVVLAPDLDVAIDLVNDLAPEHLELETDPSVVERITHAGAIFVGGWSPEPVGDYFAGPNHTLPTAGNARFASALGLADFVRHIHVIAWTEQDLRRHGAKIAAFARSEGLVAHARAVEVRLEQEVERKSGHALPALDPAGFVLPSVRRQRPYRLDAPPEAPVKLNQNEAPDDLPDALKAEILELLGELDWRRYPPFEPTALRTRVAEVNGWTVPGTLIGNGSNDLLTLLLRSVVGEGDTVVRPDPCFSLYPLHLDAQGARQVLVPLREANDFAYDLDHLVAAARSAKVVLLTSPNNPTGSVLPRGAVERLLTETSALIVVDEAYREWCGQDFAPLLGERVPLVLLRTFSKALAAAALRFGFLLGPPSLCDELRKVALPYSVNALTQTAILHLLGRGDLLAARVAHVMHERTRLVRELRQRGRRVVEGGANFVLVSSSDPPGELGRWLRHGVLVRDLSSSVPGYLRVSVGCAADTDAFLAALDRAV